MSAVKRGVAYLIVSEGVTAKMASIIPAPSPATRLRGALTLPFVPQSVQWRIDHDRRVRWWTDGGDMVIEGKRSELTFLSASACLNLS